MCMVRRMALEFAVGFIAQVTGDQSREQRGLDERDHMAQYTSLPYATPAVQRPSSAADKPRSGLAVGRSDWLARSFSLQTLRFAVHSLAPRRGLRLSQGLTNAPEIIAMLGSKLPPMPPHFSIGESRIIFTHQFFR